VAGLVVGGTCRSCGRSRTGVQGVGVVGSPSIGESVMGVLEHFAAATALDLAALLALVITSFCDFVFRALSAGRRGQLRSSAG
jgi:hypothetical protein